MARLGCRGPRLHCPFPPLDWAERGPSASNRRGGWAGLTHAVGRRGVITTPPAIGRPVHRLAPTLLNQIPCCGRRASMRPQPRAIGRPRSRAALSDGPALQWQLAPPLPQHSAHPIGRLRSTSLAIPPAIGPPALTPRPCQSWISPPLPTRGRHVWAGLPLIPVGTPPRPRPLVAAWGGRLTDAGAGQWEAAPGGVPEAAAGRARS
ncbi:hypothetical protein chiPu_0027866 [Chiloscyllium punctatum]|uniref:Uncharacterized protein n=1 Tax=Chiloscyllium punctatum TaxID=137246 RepID=A0A401TLX5_CHIPU|nr:hypothetical protein [Chiloscyllium punctatum]